MKTILLILLMMANLLHAKVDAEKLSIYANSDLEQIELKWLVDNYSSKNSYKIYRSVDGSEFKHLTTLKPRSYKHLKDRGYSDDYIFMIYPNKDIKTFDDRIRLLKVEQNVQGFRILKIMREKQFAKNIGQYFLDKNVKKDKLYTYLIQMYKDKKHIYQKMIRAHTFKTKPKNDFMWVDAKSVSGGIGLTWDMQNNFAFFNVYRKMKNEKNFTKLNQDIIYLSKEYTQNSKAYYLDQSVKEGDKATYYIRKFNMFSVEGIPSQEVIGQKVTLSKPPSSIKNVFIKSSDKQVIIRWEKNYNILGYNVYRSTIYQGSFEKINKKPIKKEVYIDKNFQAGKNYYYYVTTINMNGESKPSMKILAYSRDTTPPVKPQNLTYKVEAGKVLLKWDSLKGSDVFGYRIYVSMSENASEWALVNDKLIKSNSFKHERPKSLSRFDYYYRVTAVDQTYNESFPSKIVKVKLPDVTLPDQPNIMTYRAYADKIKLEWNKIMVYDLSHYNVYRKTGKEFKKLNKKPLTNSVFIDKKPMDGINEYVIVAVDNSGNESQKTASRKIGLIDNKPVKITDFKLKRTKKGVMASFKSKDKDYAGFKLFKSSGEILKYYNVSNFIKGKKFEDTQVSENGTYFYMIKAYDKAGNIKQSNVLKIVLKKKN